VNELKKDSTIKIIGLSVLALIVLWLIKTILFGAGFGMGVNVRTNYGGGSMYMGTSLGFGLSISLLLTYLIKFLFIVFIVGLIGGLVVAAKNYIFTPEDIEVFKAPFKAGKSTITKTTCMECGKELNADWKACPYCGTSTEKFEL
jgi:hypothetical protein